MLSNGIEHSYYFNIIYLENQQNLDYLGFKNINLPNSDINIVILENNIGIVLPKSFGDSAKVDTTAKP